MWPCGDPFCLFGLQKEHYMNYYALIKHAGTKRSDQTPIAEEYARVLEADEGRMPLRVKIEIDPFYDPAAEEKAAKKRKMAEEANKRLEEGDTLSQKPNSCDAIASNQCMKLRCENQHKPFNLH